MILTLAAIAWHCLPGILLVAALITLCAALKGITHTARRIHIRYSRKEKP